MNLNNSPIFNTLKRFSITEKLIFAVLSVTFLFTGLVLILSLFDPLTTKVPTLGGEIHEGMIGSPQFINPILSVTESGKNMSELIYSGLLKENADGSLTPNLADKYSISSDGLTYDIFLKKNLVFHDGKKLNADDVVFTIDTLKDPLIKSPEFANWQGVEVKKIDDLHLQFILKTAYAPFVKNMTIGILPKHLWQDANIEQFTFSPYNSNPVGSGPYKIKSVIRDTNGKPTSYNLESFNKYALGAPFIQKITINFYEDENALIDAINKGTINSAGDISTESVSKIKNQNVEIKSAPLLRMFGVFFNQKNSKVLSDKAVRQKLESAINRKDLVDKVLLGFGNSETLPIPSIFAPDGFANTTGPAKLKSTSTIAFSLSTGDTPELQNTANFLKDLWGQIGIKVEVKTNNVSTLSQEVIKRRDFEALLFGEVVTRDIDLYPFWHSSQRSNPGLNITSFANLKADKSLEKGRQATSTANKVAAYKDFIQGFQDETPAIFLYSPNYIYVLPKNIQGFNMKEIENPEERYDRLSESFISTKKVFNFLIKN